MQGFYGLDFQQHQKTKLTLALRKKMIICEEAAVRRKTAKHITALRWWIFLLVSITLTGCTVRDGTC